MDRCAIAECSAAPAGPFARCWGHVSDEEFKKAIRDHTGPTIDARGSPISGARVSALLRRSAAAGGAQPKTLRTEVDLSGAAISGDIEIGGFTLARSVRFFGARIDGGVTVASLSGLKYLRLGSRDADRTTMSFLDVTGCQGDDEDLSVAGVEVGQRIRFEALRLRDVALTAIRGAPLVTLSDVRVRELSLTASDLRRLDVRQLRVEGATRITDLVAEEVVLADSRFESWADVSPCASVWMRRCAFDGSTSITWTPIVVLARHGATSRGETDAATDRVVVRTDNDFPLGLDSVRISSSASIRWAGSEVRLRRCLFGEASVLDRHELATAPPRLVDLTETDGQQLRVGDVDVSRASFAAASTVAAIDSERLKSGFGAAGVTLRRRLADEGKRSHYLGMTRAARRGQAQRLASTYRDLRTKAEAVGYHAGANDLHYGERLWQRKAARRFGLTWAWLAVYGLLGYGVRPSRTLLWLALLVVGAAQVFGAVGGLERTREVAGTRGVPISELCASGASPRTLGEQQTVRCPADTSERYLFALGASTTLVRPAEGYRTEGDAAAVEITTRLLAALLFGLLVLAVRNRARR